MLCELFLSYSFLLFWKCYQLMLMWVIFIIFISVILKMLPIDAQWVIFIIFISVTLKMLPIDAQWVIFCHIHFCYFANVSNWCSVSYFYHIPSVILKMLPIDAMWVIFIIFISVILKMLPIDALWVIFIIFLLLFWKCYQLMLSELFLSYSFLLFWKCYQLILCELFLSYFENVTCMLSELFFVIFISVILKMLPIDAQWVIFIIFLLLKMFWKCYQLMLSELFLLYSFCYFENVTNWFSVSYFYHIPSVVLKMLPIDAMWVIFIIFLLLFWKCYQLMLSELFLSYSFLLFWKCY